jgi:hypothetical protein
VRFDDGIVDVAARQHVGELVADQFADPKLALRAASGLLAMVVTWHFLFCPGLTRASILRR